MLKDTITKELNSTVSLLDIRIVNLQNKQRKYGKFDVKQGNEIIRSSKTEVDNRKNDLAIVEDSLEILKRLTANTYWVFNIKSTKHLKEIIKERQGIVALYKRKIKMLETRLSRIEHIVKLSSMK